MRKATNKLLSILKDIASGKATAQDVVQTSQGRMDLSWLTMDELLLLDRYTSHQEGLAQHSFTEEELQEVERLCEELSKPRPIKRS